MLKCLIPVVMSGIIAVYALVISVLIAQDLQPPSQGSYSLFKYAYIPYSRVYLRDAGSPSLLTRRLAGSCTLPLGYRLG